MRLVRHLCAGFLHDHSNRWPPPQQRSTVLWESSYDWKHVGEKMARIINTSQLTESRPRALDAGAFSSVTLMPSWVRLTVHAHPLLRDQVLPIETTVSHSVALLDSLDSDNDSDLQNNASSNAASFLLDFLLVSTWSSFVCLYMTRLPEI